MPNSHLTELTKVNQPNQYQSRFVSLQEDLIKFEGRWKGG